MYVWVCVYVCVSVFFPQSERSLHWERGSNVRVKSSELHWQPYEHCQLAWRLYSRRYVVSIDSITLKQWWQIQERYIWVYYKIYCMFLMSFQCHIVFFLLVETQWDVRKMSEFFQIRKVEGDLYQKSRKKVVFDSRKWSVLYTRLLCGFL